jgi:short subunit dehydrogenase-like uncharacterized protein
VVISIELLRFASVSKFIKESTLNMKFLLYGANGYTGKIILEYAELYGLTPVIAGRSADKLKPLAEQFKVDYVAFGLSNQQNIVQHIKDFKLVLNCVSI